jgi:preprotein translocase subunit SecG
VRQCRLDARGAAALGDGRIAVGKGEFVEFRDYIYIAQILVSILLTLVLLLQSKGAGVGTALGGGTGGSFRTRRGVEKSLFQLTIVLAIIFLAVSIISVQQTV